MKPILLVACPVCLLNCSYLPRISGDEPIPQAPAEKTGAKPSVAPKLVKKPNIPAAKLNELPQVVDLAQGKVVFLRSSVVASAVGAKLYDVTGGAPVFLAQAANNTQVHLTLKPGNYTFMLASEDSVDYLHVHVAPNLTYYCVVKPNMGAWKPSFSLYPIKPRSNGDDSGSDNQYFFDDEKVESLLSAMTPIVDAQYQRSKRQDEEMMAKHVHHWQEWKSKSPEQHARKTLNSLDGR